MKKALSFVPLLVALGLFGCAASEHTTKKTEPPAPKVEVGSVNVEVRPVA